MSFQVPRSIAEMLPAIHQREFVWGADQITRLLRT